MKLHQISILQLQTWILQKDQGDHSNSLKPIENFKVAIVFIVNLTVFNANPKMQTQISQSPPPSPLTTWTAGQVG